MESTARNAAENFSLELHHDDQFGRNCIDEELRSDAKQVCEIQDLDIDTREILFLADKSGQVWREPMGVFLIPPILSDAFFQLTGYRFRFVFKMWDGVMQRLGGEAQYAAYLYHTLLFLRRDAKTHAMALIPRAEVREWRKLLPYVGEKGYHGIPNMLELPLMQITEEVTNDDRETQSE